jgi:hypothetical protein
VDSFGIAFSRSEMGDLVLSLQLRADAAKEHERTTGAAALRNLVDLLFCCTMTAVKNLVTTDRCMAKEINQAQHVVMSPNFLTFLSLSVVFLLSFFSLGGIQTRMPI